MSGEFFALMHLAIVIAILIAVAVLERRDRRTWSNWHGGVRTRHLTSEEMLRRLRRARR